MYTQKIDYIIICLFFWIWALGILTLNQMYLDTLMPYLKLILTIIFSIRVIWVYILFKKYIKIKNSIELAKAVIISMPFEFVPLLILMFIAEFLQAITLW